MSVITTAKKLEALRKVEGLAMACFATEEALEIVQAIEAIFADYEQRLPVKLVNPVSNPRYDEVYERGVARLNEPED